MSVIKHGNSGTKEDEEYKKVSEITFLKGEGKTCCGDFIISDKY